VEGGRLRARWQARGKGALTEEVVEGGVAVDSLLLGARGCENPASAGAAAAAQAHLISPGIGSTSISVCTARCKRFSEAAGELVLRFLCGGGWLGLGCPQAEQ